MLPPRKSYCFMEAILERDGAPGEREEGNATLGGYWGVLVASEYLSVVHHLSLFR